MKKIIPILILILISKISVAQDTTYSTKICKCTYSLDKKMPKIIQYKIYKGGGEAKRKNSFTQFSWSAKNKDYRKSGYDRGHLCSAEDFAFNQKLQNLTFSLDLVIPQTHKLNNGIFKDNENEVREHSQTDSLLITYINIPSNTYIGDSVYVPLYTYKIVQSLTSRRILYCIKFIDGENPRRENISLQRLKVECNEIKFELK